jgi:hypothetical protein
MAAQQMIPMHCLYAAYDNVRARGWLGAAAMDISGRP